MTGLVEDEGTYKYSRLAISRTQVSQSPSYIKQYTVEPQWLEH